ncbi:hypothetical protein TanjilG_21096 [Lupinus angustifolius]|uniref:Uncharacterized protein n=1 Tax=Lupinus angustifolius TaxID=3871 RepID=A0A1J7GNF2_LUPAN|nr:hypothetical protein TanjilG_21096 [Lupinus angustifolius]
MISLGRGFYEFSFSSIDDMRSVYVVGSWNLKLGLIRLFLWTPDFNPSIQKLSHAQCWVKLVGLPPEYWSSRILFSIAGGIGVPISLDEATNNRSFGHFANVLVDINLKATLPEQILVEQEGFSFFVSIEYKNLPDLCSGCHYISHLVSNCRKMAKNDGAEEVSKIKNPSTSKPAQSGKDIDIYVHLEIDREANIPEGIEKVTANATRVITDSSEKDINDSSDEDIMETRVEESNLSPIASAKKSGRGGQSS